MTINIERPEHVPAQVWEAAVDLSRAWDPAIAKEWIRNLERLLYGTTPAEGNRFPTALAPFWRLLVDAVEARGRRADPEDRLVPYKAFLDVLCLTPAALDAEMKPALEEVGRRMEKIAALATELADEWDAAVALRESKGIGWSAGEYELLTTWAEATGCKIECPGWRDFPALAPLLRGLADAMERTEITPPRYYGYATLGAGGVAGAGDVTALVRFFDARLADLTHWSLPADFAVSDNHLAQLLSALLGRPVSRLAVLQARNRAKKIEDSSCPTRAAGSDLQ
ncbi:MAG: hypothetical protein FD187_2369 [bacterium]|nr:MAG: hypothetical protein FD142_1012 [bacterium]KAF0147938.1 MAG: hypothetical protein FD187_2369 [bacterium]KAF0168120.1 MAG: hypothetical protein FD158_1668 [bacterium]TXT22579.1 MAG: hypothetical protein FD132_389 [bacterium]